MTLTILAAPYVEPDNEPPQFAEETPLSGYLLTTKTTEPTPWSYVFPGTYDVNGDTVTMSVDVK